MGYKSREIETKWIVRGADLSFICNELDRLLRTISPIRKWGSSVDTYYKIEKPERTPDFNPTGARADFARVRERDGIRQLTVKGKDRGTNDDRLEIDLDCTSPTPTILKFFTAILGKSLGTVKKDYYVWVAASSDHDTVSAYTVEKNDFLKDSVILEFEARTAEGVAHLEQLVLDSIRQNATITIERAPGSLYEMCILKET